MSLCDEFFCDVYDNYSYSSYSYSYYYSSSGTYVAVRLVERLLQGVVQAVRPHRALDASRRSPLPPHAPHRRRPPRRGLQPHRRRARRRPPLPPAPPARCRLHRRRGPLGSFQQP